MGRNKRKSRQRGSKNPAKPKPIASHFTEVEEEFFKAGMQYEAEVTAAESFDDLDDDYRRPGLLDRLFSRWQPTLA